MVVDGFRLDSNGVLGWPFLRPHSEGAVLFCFTFFVLLIPTSSVRCTSIRFLIFFALPHGVYDSSTDLVTGQWM
jgi:hypothetical protein